MGFVNVNSVKRTQYTPIMSGCFVMLSPAKTMDMSMTACPCPCSQPRLKPHTKTLVEAMRSYSPTQLSRTQSISSKLASLNADRWAAFGERNNPRGPAAMVFQGDVYRGLEAWSLSARPLSWCQRGIRILSGLYGALRPLDRIQPYRLEMGTKISIDHGSNLYEFWGDAISKLIARDITSSGSTLLVNLASKEYAHAVSLDHMPVPSIEVRFLQKKGSQAKFVAVHAKRARGLMARWIAEHRPKNATDLTHFDSEGYLFTRKSSTEDTLTFVRPM